MRSRIRWKALALTGGPLLGAMALDSRRADAVCIQNFSLAVRACLCVMFRLVCKFDLFFLLLLNFMSEKSAL